MAVDFNTAINAYRQAAGTVANVATGNVPTTSLGGDDQTFATLVTDSLKLAVESSQVAEDLTLRAIAGEADMKDVIMAVANAEHTLETVVAVRDKVLTAYQEILRMPI